MQNVPEQKYHFRIGISSGPPGTVLIPIAHISSLILLWRAANNNSKMLCEWLSNIIFLWAYHHYKVAMLRSTRSGYSRNSLVRMIVRVESVLNCFKVIGRGSTFNVDRIDAGYHIVARTTSRVLANTCIFTCKYSQSGPLWSNTAGHARGYRWGSVLERFPLVCHSRVQIICGSAYSSSRIDVEHVHWNQNSCNTIKKMPMLCMASS